MDSGHKLLFNINLRGQEKSYGLGIVIFLLFLLFPDAAIAQWVEPDSLISISRLKQDFRQHGKNDSLGVKEITDSLVVVSGITNVSSGLLHETYLQTYIQSDSAGVSVFGYQIDEPFSAGDSIVVKGVKQYYFGQPELMVKDYKVYPVSGVPKPVNIFKAFEHPRQYQAMLMHGTGIIREKGTRFNGKYLMISPADTASQAVMIYVSNFHARYQDFDFKTPGIGDKVTVTGILGQYDPASPEAKTYKVFLRTPDDFSYAEWPRYYFKILIIVINILIVIAASWIFTLRSQVKRKTWALQNSLEEKEVLLKEIHHRVKNNLAVISGLLQLQSGTTESSEVHDALQESQSRITSMAIVHEKLYQSASLQNIPMKVYLKELAESIGTTFTSKAADINIEVNTEQISLDTEQVIPLGLLVNELLVNAFKHAFNGQRRGRIWIELIRENGKVQLKVEDNGVGLPDDLDPAQSSSLGMLLINTFARQLRAEKSIKNTPGACFTFRFPA